MYLETIKSKRKGKTYTSHLVRETYRENGKVKHRTICNVTKLPAPQLLQLKNSFQNVKGSFSINDLEIGKSVEYGASYAFMQLARELKLDKMIFSKKEQWREDALAMIVGRIVFQGSKLSLTNIYKDSALWELANHMVGAKPDVELNCYDAMDKLLKRKSIIERKLSARHLRDGCIVLYDMTNTWLEGKYTHSNYVSYGKPKGGKRGYKQIAIGLLTDKHGCPVGIEVFKGSTSDQTTVLGEVKKLSVKYGLKNIILTGDRGMLTQKRIDEVVDCEFNTITALTHTQLKTLLEKDIIQMELFDQRQIIEVLDDEDEKVRYMLCKNDHTMLDERRTRKALINKAKKTLTTKAQVKRKRDKLKVAASIGRLFERCKVEKFFQWGVDDRGGLTWSLKEDVIEKEERFDGCYVIRTEISKEKLNKDEVVNSYKGLQKVEQAFKNMKTVMLELRPMYHKKDERLIAHIFIVALAYYIQWHAMQKLKPLFQADGKYKNKRWTFGLVVERLKSIRLTESLVNGIVIKRSVSCPDAEQKQILELLEVKLK